MKKYIRSISFLSCFFVIVAAQSFVQADQLGSEKLERIKVKVVSLNGCPATVKTIRLIEETARDLGLIIDLQHVVVKTLEDANNNRHLGSPTVQIEGLDIDPRVRNIEQFGLT